MEFFNFDPNELQILENIEFDETIQRPEKVRFFTLAEQTTDAYEKLMPRGRVTRFQRDEVRREVDNLQSLYGNYVVALPEEYKLREPSYGKKLSWVFPAYADPSYKEYTWDTQWKPLFDNLRLPGFYPRLLAALPRPYGDTATGVPYPVSQPTTMLTQEGTNPRQVLPEYNMTRTQRHEDKTISVVQVPVSGTEDIVNVVGYYLAKRPLEVPNPLAEHPFLASQEASFVDSTAPLKDVVPSLDAILTHGVPVTKDPYGEAMPFLKLYDVRLQDIPWSTWTSKFPPVDIINEAPVAPPVEYPKPSQLAPPDNVIDAYKSSYAPGVSVRKWLLDQLDGGTLIPTLLLSQAIDNGSVESIPGVDVPLAAFPETTLEECKLTGKTFQDFLITGLLRRTLVGDKQTLQCVPLEFVKQERARVGYLNRKPWAETTGDDIKKSYIRQLESIRPPPEAKLKIESAPKTPQRPDSIRRAEVLAILEDPRRFADDKLRDIREVLRDTTLMNQQYSDSDTLFVCCNHTLAVLGGDLEANRQTFYETWTARVNGFRVCKFCGEQINSDVFVDQVQFDEDGAVIRRTAAFEEPTFHGAAVRSFATGITSMRPLFVDGNAHDDMVLLLLSVLHVLPVAESLNTVLKFGRAVAGIQFNKGGADQIAKFTGLTGIATVALLLQTHLPTLVPRRAFGPKPLMLSGYPRDSETPGEVTIVDSLLLAIRKTFESFPTSFKGPAQQAIRTVLGKPTEAKNTVIALLSAKSPLLKGLDKLPSPIPELLLRAKAYYTENPPRVQVPKTLIPVVVAPKELGTIVSFEECPSSRPVWTSGRLPQVVQAIVKLRQGIRAASNGVVVRPSPSTRSVPTPTPKGEIRARLAKQSAVQVRIPIGDAPVANLMLASRVSDMFFLQAPVREVDPTEGASIVRDISRGLLAETLTTVQREAKTRTMLEEQRTKDVALYTLTADYAKEKAEVNRLVATERLKFVQRMAQRTDTEREILQDLLAIGLAPYIISRSDREEFARRAELLQELIGSDEEAIEDLDGEIGVGQPRDLFEQGDEPPAGVDNGDYGDYTAIPANEDYDQPQLNDDAERSI